MQSDHLDKGLNGDPEDAEMAVEALEASCIVRPTKDDGAAARGQNQDSTRGQFSSGWSNFEATKTGARLLCFS